MESAFSVTVRCLASGEADQRCPTFDGQEPCPRAIAVCHRLLALCVAMCLSPAEEASVATKSQSGARSCGVPLYGRVTTDSAVDCASQRATRKDSGMFLP